MDVFFAVPPSKLFAMPLVFYAQVGLAMITLARLKFSVPNPWTPDLPPMQEILERLARNLDQAMDASSREEGKDVRNKRLAQWAAWVRILEGAVTAGGLEGVAGPSAEDVNKMIGAAGGDVAALAAAAQTMGPGAMAGLYSTPPLDGTGPGGTYGTMTVPGISETELLETDWSALLDDMCGYGLFGYTDDGALQGVLDGYAGTVQM
jgi:hypothetical protein